MGACRHFRTVLGYSRDDQNWRPATYYIRNLVRNSSLGGNLAINFGPLSAPVAYDSVIRLELASQLEVDNETIGELNSGGIVLQASRAARNSRCRSQIGTPRMRPQAGMFIFLRREIELSQSVMLRPSKPPVSSSLYRPAMDSNRRRGLERHI